VTVGVPHDQRHPAIDDGPRYDSTVIFPALGAGGHDGNEDDDHDYDDGRRDQR
jgi:hypothetical protein